MTAISLNAQGALYHYNWTGINATIPDANPSGYVNNQAINDTVNTSQSQPAFLPNPYIVSVVDVKIALSGGWNGDLVAYLRYDSGAGVGFTTLLNRVGGDPSSSVYTTSGMNVTLIEGAGSGNIHNTIPSSGGTYQVDSTGSSPSFSSFQGLNPIGTWSIFFADFSGGHVSTLNSWGLDLEVVPEPVNVALGVFGMVIVGAGVVRRYFRKNRVTSI